MKKLLFVILVMGFILPKMAMAQFGNVKTIFVTPDNAKIFYNGHEVGSGTYQIKFKKNDDFAVLKFEAPGYITQKVKVFRSNPNKTLSFTLSKDEAMANSIGGEDGVDVANKFFLVQAKEGLSENDVWKRIVNIAINKFENVEVMDKDAGWVKTAWIYDNFTNQSVRTRLEIRYQYSGSDQLTYKVKLYSEIAEGSTKKDEDFQPYDRVLRKYNDIVTELQTMVGHGL